MMPSLVPRSALSHHRGADGGSDNGLLVPPRCAPAGAVSTASLRPWKVSSSRGWVHAGVVLNGLREILPAVGGHRRACDQPGIVGCEKDDATRDLVRLAETADRNERQDALFQHVFWHRRNH